MPTVANTQVLFDKTHEARIKLTAAFDGTGQEINQVKITPVTLRGALNTTGHILAGNTNPRPFYNVAVKALTWSIVGGGRVDLRFDYTGGNNLILSLQGDGSLPAGRGPGLEIHPYGANASNISVTTTGLNANAGYTVILDLRKEPTHFDQGQWQDKAAFNFNGY